MRSRSAAAVRVCYANRAGPIRPAAVRGVAVPLPTPAARRRAGGAAPITPMTRISHSQKQNRVVCVVSAISLPSVPEGLRILAGSENTGRTESKISQPRRGDRPKSRLSPLRGSRVCRLLDPGGFTHWYLHKFAQWVFPSPAIYRRVGGDQSSSPVYWAF